MTENITQDQIREELATILDPCSCKTEKPVNIVDLGLIEEIDIEGESVTVELLLTSDVCIYFLDLSEEIEEHLVALPGITNVTVNQNQEKVWTPDRMATNERDERQARFDQLMDENGIEPYQERNNA